MGSRKPADRDCRGLTIPREGGRGFDVLFMDLCDAGMDVANVVVSSICSFGGRELPLVLPLPGTSFACRPAVIGTTRGTENAWIADSAFLAVPIVCICRYMRQRRL